MRCTARAFLSPNVGERLGHGDRDQKRANALVIRVVAIGAPRPTQSYPQPKPHHQVKGLDVPTEHNVVPFQNYLALVVIWVRQFREFGQIREGEREGGSGEGRERGGLIGLFDDRRPHITW